MILSSRNSQFVYFWDSEFMMFDFMIFDFTIVPFWISWILILGILDVVFCLAFDFGGFGHFFKPSRVLIDYSSGTLVHAMG